jgi:hypothetical protein
MYDFYFLLFLKGSKLCESGSSINLDKFLSLLSVAVCQAMRDLCSVLKISSSIIFICSYK